MNEDDFYQTYDGPPPAMFFYDADHSYEATKADIFWARSVGADVIRAEDYNHPFQRGVAEPLEEPGDPRRFADGLFVI